MKINLKSLVAASILVGISIILTRMFSLMLPLAGLPALRISFGSIPLIMSGILFGPLVGGLSGVAADIMGMLLNPSGTFFIGFTLSSALQGIIPGLIYYHIKKKPGQNLHFFNAFSILLFAIGIVFVLISREVLTFADNTILMYGHELSIIYALAYIFIVSLFISIPIYIGTKSKSETSLYSIDKILFITTVNYIFISLCLNTIWLSILFQKGVFVFLPGRILASLVMIPLHASILYMLSKFFKYMQLEY